MNSGTICSECGGTTVTSLAWTFLLTQSPRFLYVLFRWKYLTKLLLDPIYRFQGAFWPADRQPNAAPLL